MGAQLAGDDRRIDGVHPPQVGVGEDAGGARAQRVEQEDRQRRQVDVVGAHVHMARQDGVLGLQEVVAAGDGPGAAGGAGGEGDQRGAVHGDRPHRGAPDALQGAGGQRAEAAGVDVDVQPPQLGVAQPQQLGLARADEALELQPGQVLPQPGGGRGDVHQRPGAAGAQQAQQAQVERDAHRRQQQEAVPGRGPGLVQPSGDGGGLQVELLEGHAAAAGLDQGEAIAVVDGEVRQVLDDVLEGAGHRSRRKRA